MKFNLLFGSACKSFIYGPKKCQVVSYKPYLKVLDHPTLYAFAQPAITHQHSSCDNVHAQRRVCFVSVMRCAVEVKTQPASDTTEFVLSSFVKHAIALHPTIFNLPDHHHGCLPTILRVGATTLCKRANLLPR